MNRFELTRRSLFAGVAVAALGGCMRLDPRKPVRTLVFRLPLVSRPALWETVQKYAAQNHLACHLLPARAGQPRNFVFLARGQGLDIVGRNNAYDPLQPNDYEVRFYAESLFGASHATLNRFADSFRATVLADHSVHLISDT